MANDRVARWWMKGFRWVGIAAMALLVAGCESVPPPAEGVDRAFSNIEDYRIGADDRVQVTVWRNPELSVIAPVRPDGKISVPLLGDVAAGGPKPAEVAGNIQKQLLSFLREPNVPVIVTEFRSPQYLTRLRVTHAALNTASIPHR